MLNENIKSIRISKGLSQEELAMRLHVVRQTISKWERGLSVPDSDMIISLAKVLETSVSVLLGEAINEGALIWGRRGLVRWMRIVCMCLHRSWKI